MVGLFCVLFAVGLWAHVEPDTTVVDRPYWIDEHPIDTAAFYYAVGTAVDADSIVALDQAGRKCYRQLVYRIKLTLMDEAFKKCEQVIPAKEISVALEPHLDMIVDSLTVIETHLELTKDGQWEGSALIAVEKKHLEGKIKCGTCEL